MMRRIIMALFVASLTVLVSCEQPNSGGPFDKNTMKGSWEFVSATDGKTYGDLVIRMVGTPNLYAYVNFWTGPNPWTVTTETNDFAIMVEEDDVLNMVFDGDQVHAGDTLAFELRDCGSQIGDSMVLLNISAMVSYTFTRTAEW